MMAAPIAVVGIALEPGAPVMLFPTRIVGGGVVVQIGAAPITLIQYWNPDAKE